MFTLHVHVLGHQLYSFTIFSLKTCPELHEKGSTAICCLLMTSRGFIYHLSPHTLHKRSTLAWRNIHCCTVHSRDFNYS